METTQN